MDKPRSKAVTEAFVRLYKQGLIYRSVPSPYFVVRVEHLFLLLIAPLCFYLFASIQLILVVVCHLSFIFPLMDGMLLYRDYRLVNWDCTLRTAISDVEVVETFYCV